MQNRKSLRKNINESASYSAMFNAPLNENTELLIVIELSAMETLKSIIKAPFRFAATNSPPHCHDFIFAIHYSIHFRTQRLTRKKTSRSKNHITNIWLRIYGESLLIRPSLKRFT